VEECPIVESEEARRLRIRRGYTEFETWDACELKERFERDNGQPLAWSRERLEEARRLPFFDSYPMVWYGADGRLHVLDGRHRIAAACERGQLITVAVKRSGGY
jgi:hypothetical protein